MEKNFLIKRIDGVYFDIKKDQYQSIFTPTVVSCEPVKTDGYSVQTSNGVIAFIYEDEGLLIVFKEYKGQDLEISNILNEIQQNLEKVTGSKCVLVSL